MSYEDDLDKAYQRLGKQLADAKDKQVYEQLMDEIIDTANKVHKQQKQQKYAFGIINPTAARKVLAAVNKKPRFSGNFNGFSGCDIEVYHQGHYLCALATISFQETREMAPLYTMGSGNADPRKFKRRRAIAGSVTFKNDAMKNTIPNKIDEIRLTARNEHNQEYQMHFYQIEFLPGMETFIAGRATGWEKTEIACECGGDKVGGGHSDWCPKS